VIIVAAVALITILSVLATNTLTKDYLSLERAQVERNIGRIRNALALKTAAVSNNAKDWSNWDDAYQYMLDKNRGFESSAMPENLFAATKIDLVAFHKPDRAFVIGYERVKDSDTRAPIDSDILEYFVDPKNPFLVEMANDASVEGIVPTRRGPLMLISRPIVTSKGEGPMRGWLFFGSFIDENMVKELSTITQLRLAFQQKPHESTDAIDNSGIAVKSDGIIEAHVSFNDMRGALAFEIHLEQSRDIHAQGLRTIRWITVSMSLVALLFALMIFILVDRILLRRIRLFARISEEITSELDLSRRVKTSGNDELSTLERDFNQMVETLERYTENLRRILDNVTFGFFLVDRSLTICEGHSRSCLALLQRESLINAPLGDILGLTTPEKETFDESLRLVFSGEIPDELSLAMLPMKFHIQGTTLRCTAKVVRGRDSVIEHLLFSVVDVTDLENVERQNRENQSIIRALRFQQAFVDFLDETTMSLNRMRDALNAADQPNARRILHALKSSFGFFSFFELTEQIHEFEGRDTITPEMVDLIAQSLDRFVDRNRVIILPNQNEEQTSCETHESLQYLEQLIERPNVTLEEIRAQFRTFCVESRFVPVSTLIQTLPAIVEQVALHQCKEVKFVVQGERVRVPKNSVSRLLFTLPLLIKNAVIHGIEPSHERGTKGTTGNLVLAFKRQSESNQLLITLSDDGRGLNREELLKQAVAGGIISDTEAPGMSDEAAYNLVFADGLSTSTETTTHAGRGVGMGSVRKTVEALGGQIHLRRNGWGGLTVEMAIHLNGETTP
jgi:sensor domain CHASE-containing protein/HPt (histidine-containing phosphotransfer) domain-containing protein/two-component sensor histidine kinase